MRRQEHYFNLAPTTRPIGKHARKTFTHNTATTDFLLHFSTLPFLSKTITNKISFLLTKPSSRKFHQPPATSSSSPICFTNFSSRFFFLHSPFNFFTKTVTTEFLSSTIVGHCIFFKKEKSAIKKCMRFLCFE